MKIHYIGLSSFLIENKEGYRILVDPFTDTPDWILGPSFPKEFNGKPFGANIVLSSEPDLDHSYSPGGWLQNAPETKPNSNPFPNLDLRGTVVYEWNGDLNIAWHYTVDGIRVAHFADNSHMLTKEQLEELGDIDVAFMSPQKMPPETEGVLETTKKNVELLKPKVVVWAHHVAPDGMPETRESGELRPFFQEYFAKRASTNVGYKGKDSFMQLCYLLENAYNLNDVYNGKLLKTTEIEINDEFLDEGKAKPVTLLFLKQLAG